MNCAGACIACREARENQRQVLSGLAIYKPVQLHWLATIFGGYDAARVFHLRARAARAFRDHSCRDGIAAYARPVRDSYGREAWLG